jgi:hypothetical protein
MYVDALKSSIDALLNVPLTLFDAPLTFLTTPSMFFHAPSIVLKNPQTYDDASLARPLRLPKEVGPIKTTSKGSAYLHLKAL